MDFSILNILVRTRSLPASDPWFAGAPLGYYTFGQEMVVFLTLLTNLSTRFTFNLAFGLLGGTILQGAFSLARNWGGRAARRARRRGADAARSATSPGCASGCVAASAPSTGTTSGRPRASSRTRSTSTRFWSLVFADLHAHVLAIPIFLLFAAARPPARPPPRGPGRASRRARLVRRPCCSASSAPRRR